MSLKHISSILLIGPSWGVVLPGCTTEWLPGKGSGHYYSVILSSSSISFPYLSLSFKSGWCSRHGQWTFLPMLMERGLAMFTSLQILGARTQYEPVKLSPKSEMRTEIFKNIYNLYGCKNHHQTLHTQPSKKVGRYPMVQNNAIK